MAPRKKALDLKDIAAIEKAAGYGLTVEQIAHLLGMSKRTLERRMHDTPPELGASDALDRGRAIAISEVSEKCYEMAVSGHPGILQFWLKCRAGWTEKSVVEHTGKVTLEELVTGSWGEVSAKDKSEGEAE